MDSQEILLPVTALITFLLFILVSGFLFYVLSALGLKRIADKNNVKHSWLAWIPAINNYIYGKIAFKTTFRAVLFTLIGSFGSLCTTMIFFASESVNSSIATISPDNYFLISIFSSIPALFRLLLPIITYVLLFIATYKIYKKMSDKATTMLVFSILSCGFLIPIFLFAIRNNDVREQI